MTADRHNLYRNIHKGLRALLASLVAQASRTDYSDHDQVQALKSAVFEGFVLLEAHGRREDMLVEPLLRVAAPRLASTLEVAHLEQEESFPTLRALLLRAAESGPLAPRIGHAFTVALSRFAGELLVHMADEEEKAMPALQDAHCDEELQAVEEALLATIPPARLALYLGWMLPALNDRERAEILARAHAGSRAA